jgi:nucleoside-diphosphate-sugar epimerase
MREGRCVGTRSDWRGRKVLITGATGFIGRHLVERAHQAGAVVVTASRSEAKFPGASTHRALDIGDRAEVLRLIKDLEPAAILHVASSGVTEKAEFSEMLRSNVIGTDNLLAAAALLPDPPSVVIAGSGYEYAAKNRAVTEEDTVFPGTPYGVSKAAATFCAANYANTMPITVLRIFNVYGPGEPLPRLLPYIVNSVKMGEPVELTACEQVRDFVYVRDLASIFWSALGCSPEGRLLRILNVGSGFPMPLKQFVTMIVEVLCEKGLLPEIRFGARPYRENEPMYYAAETTMLRQALKALSFTPLDVGIRESVEAI